MTTEGFSARLRTVNVHATLVRSIMVHAWLDVACPWCWIAKRRFELAKTEYGSGVTVQYHSFELAPELPMDYLSSEAEFLQLHRPGRTRKEVEQAMRMVSSTGKRLGLAYDFNRVQHTNTFLAHQLLQYAKVAGLQLLMLDVLFSAFFERGCDLRRPDELVALAAEVGLDAVDVREVLEAGRYAEAVRADRDLAARYGVAKIPTYVVEGQPPIHGARRPAVFIEALRTAADSPLE